MDIFEKINGYDKKRYELGLSGYIDITFVMAEAIVNTVVDIRPDEKRDFVSADYYAMLCDMLTDEEDRFENLDDTLMAGFKLCYRLHNFLVIGFTSQLEYDERAYLASVLYNIDVHDYVGADQSSITVTDDAIIFLAAIPKELDEDEDALQQLHANLVARINRNLSRSSQRSNRY